MKLRTLLVASSLVGITLVARTHGGVGVPVVAVTRPGPGEILDLEAGAVKLRWNDIDPDDNANLALLYSPDLNNPDVSVLIAEKLPEDCDDDGDGGYFFNGAIDGGFDDDGGQIPVPWDEPAFRSAYCQNLQDAGDCIADSDCHVWRPDDVAPGNYYILGVLDDHWPDGGGGAVSFSVARGIVRVTAPGQNVPPALLITQPDGVGDQVDTCYRVRWVDTDPDDDARISLWVKRAFRNDEPILVARDISEDDMVNGFDLDMSGAVDLVDYEVFAEIDDGTNPVWRVKSPGFISRFRARPQDGGCVGTPPVWPDGNAWPVGDAGRPDGGPDGGVAADASADGGSTTDGGPGTEPPGCPGCSAAAVSPLWLAALLLVRRRRR